MPSSPRTRRPSLPVAAAAKAGGAKLSAENEGRVGSSKRPWPAEVLQLADLPARYPGSNGRRAQVARDGAREAAEALQRRDVPLFRSAFLREVSRRRGPTALRPRRQGRRRAHGAAPTRGYGASAARYEGWLQYASALGNGIASYELALHYRRQDQPGRPRSRIAGPRAGLHAAAGWTTCASSRPQRASQWLAKSGRSGWIERASSDISSPTFGLPLGARSTSAVCTCAGRPRM